MNNDYETIIGLEVHVELSTKTKIFCGCATDFGAPVNTHICPVCMGMPGALPVLNKRVLDFAIATSLALNCEINKEFRFDRKNYFYPDNPQNYQISQLYSPIGINGYVTIDNKNIRIHELHMEEDAGKLMHDPDTHETLIDFNRAGVPLLEIVSEPDMRNADEVIAYLKNLRMLLISLGVSDCRMNEGSLRADVNLSVRKHGAQPVSALINTKIPIENTESSAANDPDTSSYQPDPILRPKMVQPAATGVDTSSYQGDSYGLFGTRTEMKNLNSFKAIARAIEHESKRQISLLEQGLEISQETRRWDDTAGESYIMRAKEDAMDYRYFPDPDLPLFTISEEHINMIRKSLPELPQAKAERYMHDFGLSAHDANQIISEKKLSCIFEETVNLGASPKAVSNWLLGETMRIMNERETEADQLMIKPENLCDLISLHEQHTINSSTAKEIFEKIYDNEITDVNKYVDDNSLGMVSDTDALSAIIDQVISANPKSVSDYHAGKTKAIGFLIGQVMREMKGKADPEAAKTLLENKLRS